MKILFRRSVVLLFLLSLVFVPGIASANSSWHWVTASPRQALPFAIILTLLIEYTAVIRVGGVMNKVRVITVLALANFSSFVLPYIERAYRMRATAPQWQEAISKAFNSGPYFIVLFGFILLTLLVEIPVVYGFLQRYTDNRRKLALAILLANVCTTLMVAGMERVFLQGRW